MSTENKQKASELIKEFNSKSLSMEKINYIIDDFNELKGKDKKGFLILFLDNSGDKTILSNKMIFLKALMNKSILLNEYFY